MILSSPSRPRPTILARGTGWALPAVVGLFAACTTDINGIGGTGTGATAGSAGVAGNTTAGSGGSAAGTGTGGASGTAGTAGTAGTGGTTMPECADQAAVTPGRAPLRRLTKFEYNNTVRDLVGDTTQPAFAFPPESVSNGFGNDAKEQSVSRVLAEQYYAVAEGIATRLTGTPQALAALLPCSSTVDAATQEACARSFIDSFLPRAFRRPLVAGEAEEFLALHNTVQAANTFASGIASMIEAALQSPDFLYRIEVGQADAANPALKRPTGYEMATRLSYFLWGTQPDAALTQAAASGELSTNAGVMAQATRLLNDPQNHARTVVRFFFDNILPITLLTGLERDPAQYPTFSSAVGALMQQETRTFLEKEIFEGPGTWPGILTAPYTYVNGPLASYYGMTGVTGDAFVQAPLDTTQRLGLLTQGGVMVGLTATNHTNPVVRGGFIVNHIMCKHIALPTDPDILSQVTPPDPYQGATARDRFTQHSENPVCAGCHASLDPMGFALENFDAVGLYRTTENGVTIDTTGYIPDMVGGEISGPVELAQKLALNEEVMSCFADHWLNFAYGQALIDTDPADTCNRESLHGAFRTSGYNIKQLLLDLTQTDGFLYLGVQE